VSTAAAVTPVLDGVRVLDFGRYIAGPYCASLLAELGADVVRVEPVGGGDDRNIAPLGPDAVGGLFLQANRGKRGLSLDLASPAAGEVVRRLVAASDVVVVNLSPPAVRALGLDYASLCRVRPDVVLVTIAAFGDVGPEADRVGFDGVAQALCGAMHLSGFPGAPMKAYVPYVDYGTALAAALGAVAALMARTRTGLGQEVKASLLGTALCFAGAPLAEEAVLSRDRVATGNRGQVYGPADALRTRDGWVLVQILGRPLFERWARLIGETSWLEDPRFTTDEGRGDHGEVLSARMAAWCAERTTAQALAALGEARIPAGPVLSPRECLAHPQVQALGALQAMTYPGIGAPVPVAAPPVRLSHGHRAGLRRAPTAGEHTDEILGEIGYDTRAVRGLREMGTV
jgi:crotonobetainyl-CoA:carnitine CoA-transferase CaiB-like acyl-CoA transferase